jgi:hypothetical protein
VEAELVQYNQFPFHKGGHRIGELFRSSIISDGNRYQAFRDVAGGCDTAMRALLADSVSES